LQKFSFKGEKSNQARAEAPIAALVPMFVFVALIVVVGIYPKLVTDVLSSAASEFLSRTEYIKAVLGSIL